LWPKPRRDTTRRELAGYDGIAGGHGVTEPGGIAVQLDRA
jgi:hypothetical protein